MVNRAIIVPIASITLLLGYLTLFTDYSISQGVKSYLPSRSKSIYIRSQLEASESAYQLYVSKRKDKVGPDPGKVDPWPPGGAVTYFYDYFLPAFNCPHTIQRVGRMGDGGKWTCGFELFEKQNEYAVLNEMGYEDRPCIVYSFGVAHESSYEAEFLKRTNCEIYAFDASVDKMGPQITDNDNPKLHFYKIFIGKENSGNTKTLATIMKENGHKWVDFVKMDIEENEFPVLKQIMEEFDIIPFGQLQLEIHADNEGKTFPKLYELWLQMEERGLRAFKNEVNHWPCVGMQQRPFLMEYAFINIKGDHRLIN